MKPHRSEPEYAGEYYMERLRGYISRRGGCYTRDETGRFSLILGDRRIPIDQSRENYPLAALMLEVCERTTLDKGVQTAIQRLQVEAAKNLSEMSIRRFSAMSRDGSRVYIPNRSGELIMISADGISTEKNGFNADSFWVEHPCGDPWEQEGDPSDGFELFEKLIVDMQSCAVDAMRWLVAINEGLFCLIRDCTPARFIMGHIGPTQSGKTTGAQRFTLLHGLGDVKGDYSVAALGNIGDIGLLVMDNKEQANFAREFVDYLLFLATGAERGRSFSDGRMRPPTPGRPLGVFTSIEGVVKSELQHRVLEVHYQRKGERLGRTTIEREIRTNRHKILSGFALVLQNYFVIRGRNPSPAPLDNFEEYFAALCDLLRAYGEIAGKPEGWDEEIIREWDRTVSEKEPEEDDLEYPIIRVVDSFKRRLPGFDFAVEKIVYQGRRGTLYITEANRLLGMLHELDLREVTFPQNASGLGRRLHSAKFRAFEFVPTDRDGIAALKRQGERRPFGLFFPGET